MDEPIHPVQLEAFRRMTPERELRRVAQRDTRLMPAATVVNEASINAGVARPGLQRERRQRRKEGA